MNFFSFESLSFVLLIWVMQDVFYTYRYKYCKRKYKDTYSNCRNWMCKKWRTCKKEHKNTITS